MDLSVIILDFRSQRLTRQCLKAFFADPPRCSHEVIVVDNSPASGLAAMLAREFPGVRYVRTEGNYGCAYGNNFGLRLAAGRYPLIVNPDIIVRPGALDELVAFMDSHPDIGLAGPRLLRPDGTIDESCYRFPTLGTWLYRRTPLGRLPFARAAVDRYLMADFDHAADRDVDWLLGAAFIVRRAALEQVGPMDERYFMYFEDTDWCRRFWEGGWRVTYHPAAELVHFHDRGSAREVWFLAPLVNRAARAHIVSWFKYLLKNRFRPGYPHPAAPLPPAAANSAARARQR